MRIHNDLNIQVFKVLILLIVICFNNSTLYAQDSMEEAILSVSFSEEDNTKIITTKAVDQSGLPIEDLEVYFYVKRTFSLLPIGDPFNITDENGIVEIVFPNDLPGDAEGNVIIVVKILDSDLYSDQSKEITQNWGLPTELENLESEKRSLWASAANAPKSLIIIVCSMIFAVWYIICYIFFKLYRISKIKPLTN
ncbi:hypothetical protein RXV94_02430 [Yeosuana sp. MJ-SS3]|uniref:Cadherin domain-containing protein n=1 Tax=Gilvirhabdus luticola TaxID=3079858 RepID=A0ABU3U3L7_9FLAO|nr:hypothetical protein [Yeosuana sp. MJ-SS3]MDU8885001.1 hypothetical protein [Yeosuana sp. MJ-SS3]